jgi:hypothetical protein
VKVLGIDPGPEQTAFAWFDGTRPGLNGIVEQRGNARPARAGSNTRGKHLVRGHCLVRHGSRGIGFRNVHLDRSLLAAVRRSRSAFIASIAGT